MWSRIEHLKLHKTPNIFFDQAKNLQEHSTHSSSSWVPAQSEKFLKPTLVKVCTHSSKSEMIYCIDIHRVFILAHPHKICEFIRKK